VVITSDSSVGAGNRRVEALTGIEGFRYLARERDLLSQLTEILRTPRDEVPTRVGDLVERLRATEKELERMKARQLLGAAAEIAATAKDIGGVALVTHRAEGASGGDVRTLALDVRGRLGDRPAVVVVIGTGGDKPSAVVAVNAAAQERGLAANALVGVVGEHIGGRGGGKGDVAQGGGSDLSGIDAAFGAVASTLGR